MRESKVQIANSRLIRELDERLGFSELIEQRRRNGRGTISMVRQGITWCGITSFFVRRCSFGLAGPPSSTIRAIQS